MMKITGYKMQHALRELAHVRDIAAVQFAEGLKTFPDEMKVNPCAAMGAYLDAEAAIAASASR